MPGIQPRGRPTFFAYLLALACGSAVALPYLVWLMAQRIVEPLPSWLLWLLAALCVASALHLGTFVRGATRLVHAAGLALLLSAPPLAWLLHTTPGLREAPWPAQLFAATITVGVVGLLVLVLLALGPLSRQAIQRAARGSVT